jgi:hypothetical protein
VTDRAPLALVEIGASAGANLYWDRYQDDYGENGAYGDPDFPVGIESVLRGGRDPPLLGSFPPVASRIDIDLNPLDATDPDDTRWLRALVLLDQHERHERLTSAISLLEGDPPDLLADDALDVLPGVLGDLPEGATPCVYSTLTTYQLGEDGLVELEELLAELSEKCPIHRLSTDLSAELDYPVYRHVILDDGVLEETRLAEHEAYGKWIRWITNGGQ